MVAVSEHHRERGRRTLYKRFSRFLERHLPEKLYPRSLLIIITPMVLLQSFVALAFMDRHWDKVTNRLSRAVALEIALLIDLYETFPDDSSREQFLRVAKQRLDLSLSLQPGAKLPTERPRPFFSILDQKLSHQLRTIVRRPFWLDTVGSSNYVDIRIKLDDAVFRVITKRRRAYAPNSHIFILWMVGTSLVLLGVALIFLRNQIRPIQQLARAAQRFGMGRDVPDFEPRGALEVQRAAQAFIKMRERIKRHVEQRTTMLAGVSHDLRTMLTRFKLQLAMLGDGPEVAELRRDVDEMQQMLEDYMAFVRGDGGEDTTPTDIARLLKEVRREAPREGKKVTLSMDGELNAPVKSKAFKRCLANIVNNACRFADRIKIAAGRSARLLTITVDDDGPGVPPEHIEDVFRPFFRLDDARNRETGGTGLGLAIARDIARSHGGDIALGESPLGGLRVTVQIPL